MSLQKTRFQRFSRLAFSVTAITWPLLNIYPATMGRTIEVDPQHRTDAVAITAMMIGSLHVQCGLVISPTEVQQITPVQADSDWLKHLNMVVLNRTNKTIVFGQIVLAFPESGAGTAQNPQRVYTITLGRLPQSVAFSGATGKPLSQDNRRQPLVFMPGQKIDIHLADYIDQINANSEPILATTEITKLRVHMSSFVFEDGMRWDGTYLVADPQHPGKFTQMDGKYFPGVATWPPDYHK